MVDAVVEQVRRYHPPAWVRLSIRPRDLELFTWPCDLGREPVTLDPGGGGLILDVRSRDGPGSHTVISHRQCLADRLHPDNGGGGGPGPPRGKGGGGWTPLNRPPASSS